MGCLHGEDAAMICKDLTPYSYKLPFEIPRTFCVGWIGLQGEHSTGEVSPAYVEKLSKIVCHRTENFDVHVNVVRGIHECNFCMNEVTASCAGEQSHPLGMSEVWLPWGDSWLAAPSLVIHYMAEHCYLPPCEFLEAIDRCSMECDVLPERYLNEVLTEIADQS